MSKFRHIHQAGRAPILQAALLGLAMLAGIVLFLGRPPDAVPVRATILPSPLPLPDFSLLDDQRQPFGKSSLHDQWSLLFFGFTNCPDICPVTLQQLAAARRRLAADNPESVLPAIVFISVDPARDDSKTLAAYTGAFGDGVIGVTGELAELSKLTGTLGIHHARGEADDGRYAVEHSAAVVLVNPDAEFHAVFGAPHDVDTFVHDLPLIMTAR